jgi:hypothetical protein
VIDHSRVANGASILGSQIEHNWPIRLKRVTQDNNMEFSELPKLDFFSSEVFSLLTIYLGVIWLEVYSFESIFYNLLVSIVLMVLGAFQLGRWQVHGSGSGRRGVADNDALWFGDSPENLCVINSLIIIDRCSIESVRELMVSR